MFFKTLLTLIATGLLLVPSVATASEEAWHDPAATCEAKAELNHPCVALYVDSVASFPKKQLMVSVNAKAYNIVTRCGVEIKVTAQRYAAHTWRNLPISSKSSKSLRAGKKRLQRITNGFVSHVKQQILKEVREPSTDPCPTPGE
jgi:hypothetical protein